MIHGESFVVSAGPNDTVRWLQQEASALFSKEHNFHTHVVQVIVAPPKHVMDFVFCRTEIVLFFLCLFCVLGSMYAVLLYYCDCLTLKGFVRHPFRLTREPCMSLTMPLF